MPTYSMKTLLSRLALRYGVFFLLALMSAGILYFICSFELRTKSAVRLFQNGRSQMWVGYVSGTEGFPYHCGDTLSVVQTAVGTAVFRVEGIDSEPGMLRLRLVALEKYEFPNTCADGFIYVGKERILEKVLSRSMIGK